MSHVVRTLPSTVSSYTTRKVTNMTDCSAKIILLALFLDKAKVVLHYTHICHDCTTSIHAVKSIKYRVGANLLTQTVPTLGKYTSFVLVPTSTKDILWHGNIPLHTTGNGMNSIVIVIVATFRLAKLKFNVIMSTSTFLFYDDIYNCGAYCCCCKH